MSVLHSFNNILRFQNQATSINTSNKMHLFIWNDRRWQLIDQKSEYDKENYVVIRKLFVRWLKSVSEFDLDLIQLQICCCSNVDIIFTCTQYLSRILSISFQSDTNAAINKAFTKFGPVQHVESVKSVNAKLKPDVHEAYIIFERSADAYKAFVANRDGKKFCEEVITVLPVDTWKVAPTVSENDEIIKLSHRISKVEEDDAQFVYKMHITPGMLLRVFRSFIRLSKDFLTGLDLYYGPEDSSDDDSENETDETDDDEGSSVAKKDTVPKKEPDNDLNCITNQEFEKRIAEVLVKNVGQKFHSLTIRKTSISMEMLQWFAPVLKTLKMLKIDTVTDCSVLYALHGYCPKVISLHLDGEEWTGEFDQMPIETWPSVKDLYLNVSDMDDDEICEEGNRKFRRFIEVNPQITALQVDSIIDLDTLSTIGRTLKDLNTIAFVRQSFEGLNAVLDNLSGLTNLRGLKLSALEVEKTDLNALIKCSKRLSRLQHLQLITIFLNCEPDTEVGEDFVHLKEFCITHHYDCKCHGPNRTVSFENNNIEVPEDSSVLVLIVNTKPPGESKDKTLKADIMKAFKKTTKFFPNIIEQIEQPDKENHLYIQISSNRC